MKSVLEADLGVLSAISSLLSADKIDRDALSVFRTSISKGAPYLKGSISNYAKGLIMTFPTLCDNSLSFETASMLSKANERYIVSLLELLFSAVQLNGSDGVEILSRVHKNINFNMGIDDYIDAIDNFIDSADMYTGESVEFNAVEIAESIREMLVNMKKAKSFPVDSLNEKSLMDYTVNNVNGNTVVKEAPFFFFGPDRGSIEKVRDMIKDKNDKNKSTLDRDALSTADYLRKRDKDQFDADVAGRNLANRDIQSQIDFINKRLLDSDVKKANEIQPTLMIVKYNEIDSSGERIYDQRAFVAGVKSRLISVDSSDIVERVVSKNKTKVNFLNFIRATTGEIRFVRDFLLCVQQAKIDAKNSVKRGEAAKMWKVLEKRSASNELRKLLRAGNDASAITTLVINQETVNILKKEYRFDLERVANARMVVDAYNLLGIIIADESLDVAKFFYAGNDSFEVQSFSFLEKESNDKSYKKVINLIGQMNNGRGY